MEHGKKIAAVVIVAACTWLNASASKAGEPWCMPDWHVGDAWQVRAETFSFPAGMLSRVSKEEEGHQVVQDTYSVTVAVENEEKTGTTDCWCLSYTLGEDAPAFIQPKAYRIWLAKEGSIRAENMA